VEPRVGPGEHARDLLFVQEFQPHEQPEHGTAERLRRTTSAFIPWFRKA
jgi:hypothetical protein